MAKDKRVHVEDYADDIITKEDVLNNETLAADIIGLCVKDFNVSYSYVSRKLLMFRERHQYYSRPDVYRDQIIRIHYARQQIEAFKSLFFENKLAVDFGARELGDDELGYRINKIADAAYEAMEKKKKDYRLLDNIGFYGVGLEIKRGHSKTGKKMLYEVINPECWLPDVAGNMIDDNREYHMFIQKSTLYTLDSVNRGKPGTYFNIDRITTGSFFEYEYQDYIKKTVRMLSTYEDYRRSLRLTLYYKILNGRKYQIELCNNNSTIIRFEALPCITKEEKKDPSLVKRPVVVHNMCPMEQDPFGMGIMELTIDKQNALNRLGNLALMKETRNAGFDNYIVDLNVIQNLNLLAQRPLNGPNFIPGKTINGQPISNAIAPVNEKPVSGDTLTIMDKIDMMGQYETNFTASNRGLTQGADTATQSKQMALNSNVLFGMTSEVLSRGIISFWKNLRYRDAVENMTETDALIAHNSFGIGSQEITVDKEELESGALKRLRVVSKKSQDEQDKLQLAYLESREAIVLQDQNIPEISKRIFKRKMDELSGLSREMMYINNPLLPDEYGARHYVKMINMGESPKNMFKPDMDYFVYWVYVSTCQASDLKNKVLAQLEKAMIDQGLNKNQPQGGDMQGMLNSAGAQKTNQRLQSQNPQNQVPSLQNIKQPNG